jgi:D-alanine-D-alanine ligase
MARHVAVLMGGWSSEREVSLRTGEACARALESEGFKVSRIDCCRDVARILTHLRPEVVLNALHGPFGEDGSVQGLLEILGVPYTHSGVLASALAMHKERAKTVMRAAGISVPLGRVVRRLDAAKAHVLPPPYVLKPVSEGSSYGMFIIKEDHEHPPQELTRADWIYGEDLIAEEFVSGRELTCAIMGDRALDVIEIKVAGGGWYDYDAKYSAGGSTHVLPAKIPPDVYREVQTLALKAHTAIGCRGVTRTDIIYDPCRGGRLVVLEVNTQPGMTETSLVPELAAFAGFSFSQFVRWMVEDASCNR